jgi:hypothetical protein
VTHHMLGHRSPTFLKQFALRNDREARCYTWHIVSQYCQQSAAAEMPVNETPFAVRHVLFR